MPLVRIEQKSHRRRTRASPVILGVAIFANLANLRRLLELTRIDMLIMSYGGLRGALAFALALVLNESLTPRKKEFITAATVVVLFTVFIQAGRRERSQAALSSCL